LKSLQVISPKHETQSSDSKIMGLRVCELYLTQFMGSEPEGLELEKNGVKTSMNFG